MTTKAKSWREVLPVHPAADLLPLMTPDELKSLGDDIKSRGLLEGVALLDGELLDGRNRLDAMEAVGVKLVVNGVMDWKLDYEAMAQIDRIVAESVTDPVGPEYLTPMVRES